MRWPSIQVGGGWTGFGEDARRIGDGDAAPQRRGDVDIVDAIAEIGDELQPLAGLGDQMGVDAVGDRRHQHIGRAHGFSQLGLRHRRVGFIEPHIEQFAHARFDLFGKLAGDDDERLRFAHGNPDPPSAGGAPKAPGGS